MKLLFIPSSTCADPTYGRVLFSLGRELRRSSHDVRILSLRPGKRPDLELKGNTRGNHIYWCTPKTRAKTLDSVLKKFRPDFAHLHFSGSCTPWLAALMNTPESCGTKLALTFQDYRHPDLPPLSAPQRKLLCKAVNTADKISAISTFIKRRLAADYPACARKIRVIGNGAPEPFARAVPSGSYMLSIGRLAHYKGMDLLLMAYAEARRKGLRAPLVICGADFQNGKLKNFCRLLGLEDKVTFTGLLSQLETEKLLRGCLFFTLLSRFESFGMSALEAMACGKAALLSGVGGMGDFAKNGRNALLCFPQDTGKAARLMLKLEQDAKLRARLGSAARRDANKLSWPKLAKTYLDFYRG